MTAIDEIKGRIDIVDLVGEQVQLQRSGRNFRARCPFHNERTPSFYVSPERQTWHCFGACGTGGDVFSFVMKRDGLEFVEALRVLAARAGIALEERRKPAEREADERLAQANEAAAAYYHHVLLQSRAAEPARAYLTQRGLDQETIEAFELGYSPDSWDALKLHLTERSFSEADLLAAGLLVEGDRGPYDRFRNRLMFPIRDERGRTVGFGGRALAESDGAKYLNTPQTSMFDKGGLLYALDRAKEAIRREGSAIVVEGYMDAIAAHQQGISNVVASMGTALTERQIKTLQRFKGRILLALDADAAGVEATLRALQEAEAAGAVRAAGAAVHPAAMSEDEFAERVREWSRDALKRAATNFSVVPLSGKDPDEMIRKDRAAWDAAVASAKPFTDHVFDTVVARKDLSKTEQRAELLQELLPVVRLIEEPVYRAHYVQRLARLAQISENALQVELRRKPAHRSKAAVMSTAGAAAREERIAREPGAEFCLALLLRYPELRAEGLSLSPDLFVLAEHRAIYDAWHDSPDIDAIRLSLPDELHQHLDFLIARNVPLLQFSDLQEALRDCVRRIGLRRLSHAKQASAAALADPDLQQYMTAAVNEAVTLQGANGGALPAEDDAQASELAINLVKDTELGRKLHHVPLTARSAEASDGSPRGESES
jgi:DNA primase